MGHSPSWDHEEYVPPGTRVISGPLSDFNYPGRRFATWSSAKAYVLSHYKLVRFGCFHNRWIARVQCEPKP